jgi:hypothetical protein
MTSQSEGSRRMIGGSTGRSARPTASPKPLEIVIDLDQANYARDAPVTQLDLWACDLSILAIACCDYPNTWDSAYKESPNYKTTPHQ